MYSVDFCGSKAAEYFGLVSDSICIIAPGVDLLDTLDAHDQFFRRLLIRLQARSLTAPISVTFLVDAAQALEASVKEKISSYIINIWKDIDEKVLASATVNTFCI